MANIIESKGAYREQMKKEAEELMNQGWFLPNKPNKTQRTEFPEDLSATPADELGFLLGHYSLYESYARAKASICHNLMITFKEYQLEESDEQINLMDAVVLKLEAAGRIAARMEGNRLIYKYAEADYRKFDGLSLSYRIMKEAISREISRRDIKDRLGSYREMG